MQLYQHPSKSDLMDVLAEYKARYARLRYNGGTKEQFETCLQALEFLISEIKTRKKAESAKSAKRLDN